jgi:signal peptidase
MKAALSAGTLDVERGEPEPPSLPAAAPATDRRVAATGSDDIDGEAGPAEPAGRRGRIPPRVAGAGRVALNLAMALVVAVAVLSVLGAALGWWRFAVVLSGSMRPGIQPGDVELLQREPIDALRVGQIVAFDPPHEGFTVTHRVITLTRRGGRTVIRTKGDANDVADPWGPVRLDGTSVWRVTGVIPKAGYLTVWAREPWVRLCAMALVVVLLAFAALRRIWART